MANNPLPVPPHPNPLPQWGRGRSYGAIAGRRIGLLGGSFNPAHGGHLHISRLALTRLNLDEVWWLVSPQNPLKTTAGMAPFAERLAQAEAIAKADRRIHVSAIESVLGTTYTADTLPALRRRFPRAHFVWLMGGDNLRQFPYWRRWHSIFRTVPIAVFDRPGTAHRALASAAAYRFAQARVPASGARRLATMLPPAWAFFPSRLDPSSATEIRAARKLPPSPETDTAVTLEETNIATLTPRLHQPRKAKAAVMPIADLLRRIVETLEDGKAEEIVTIDLAGRTTIADYIVIASGRSSRQLAALTDHLEEALPGHPSIEGRTQGDWVLIDAGDVIVHIFRPEIRAYYNLEKMWGSESPDAEAATALLQ